VESHAAEAPTPSGGYRARRLPGVGRSVRRAYPADKLARLTALKDAWDPHNVFHLNHNIPAQPGSGRHPAPIAVAARTA
jgi:hypothetical protein